MEKGNYVICSKDGASVYGRVIHKRVSKFNKNQEVCSIQTKSGVYSEKHFDRVAIVPDSEASKLTYGDLHSLKKAGKNKTQAKRVKKQKETK